MAKIDYHVNDKNTMNGVLLVGRYVGDGEDRGFINQDLTRTTYIINTWTASGVWDYTANSKLVNEVRFGYNRMTFTTGSDDAGRSPVPINTGLSVPGLPTIGIGGFARLGTWHNRPQAISPNPYWDVQDSLSYLAGKHSLKFGGEFTHIEADSYIPDYGRGQINFAGSTAFGGLHGPRRLLRRSFRAAVKVLRRQPTRRMLWYEHAAFVQDDWRLCPKFTLNLGLRYEYNSPINGSRITAGPTSIRIHRRVWFSRVHRAQYDVESQSRKLLAARRFRL